MKILFLILLCHLNISLPGWLTNFKQAQEIAIEKHQLILLNFSGSDWCGPCIRLKKEIFESKDFREFSSNGLVLLNADFPRSNKTKLSKEQVKENELLADKYNSKGKFPLTLLLNEKGIVLKEWDGLPNTTPEQFVQSLKLIYDSRK